MPEEYRRAALQELEHVVTSRWDATPAPADLVSRRIPRRDVKRAWVLSGALSEEPRDLLVAVDDKFPWSLPILALVEPGDALNYPHVETNGQLCLVSTTASYALPAGAEHLEQLVEEADDLLKQGRTGANTADFYLEAHSYWRKVGSSSNEIWLTAPPPAGHSVWTAGTNNGNAVVCPDKEALSTWLKAAERPRSRSGPALIVRLQEPLHPRNYPVTMGDLIGLIEKAGAREQLLQAVSRWRARHPLYIVLVFEFNSRHVLLGASFLPPSMVRMPGARSNGIPGFRHKLGSRANGRLMALSKVPGAAPRLQVVPTYRLYLSDRTAGPAARLLHDLHVVVAGCGALGGQLAMQLAQAGVGKLTLVDGDVFDWRNVGRHVLDSHSVGLNKATALAHAITRRFPDAAVTSIPQMWDAYFSKYPQEFNHADLFISTTGDAVSNARLDFLTQNGDIPAVLFGWIEAFGVAAHAVLSLPGSGALRAITDASGVLREPVADLRSAPPLPQEPSCGAFYQPYSSLSAVPSIALLGGLAVDALLGRQTVPGHRVWVGSANEFSDNGLSLSEIWRSRLNEGGFNRRYDLIIPGPTE